MIIENYLNFYDILVNEIAGDIWIFTILGMILILYACAYTNIPFQTSVMLMFLFLSIIVAATTSSLLWVFIVLITGFFFYYMYAKFFRKG